MVVRAIRTEEEMKRATATTFGTSPMINVLRRDTGVAQIALVMILGGFLLQLIGNLA